MIGGNSLFVTILVSEFVWVKRAEIYCSLAIYASEARFIARSLLERARRDLLLARDAASEACCNRHPLFVLCRASRCLIAGCINRSLSFHCFVLCPFGAGGVAIGFLDVAMKRRISRSSDGTMNFAMSRWSGTFLIVAMVRQISRCRIGTRATRCHDGATSFAMERLS